MTESRIDEQRDLAWTLARNIAQVGFQDLPAVTVETTKRSVLDTLGVIVAASALAPGLDAIVELVRETGGREESTVLSYGFKAPAHMAAFANGAMAHCLDYEEVSTPLGHPSASTVPSGFAVAERKGNVSGRELITALALGNDLFCRLVNSFPQHSLWHKVTVAGIFASAATSAKLLGLDEERTVDALGLAFCQAAGTMELRFGVGSNIGGFRDAFSNKGGVLSALMSQKGVHGVRSCFDGKAGLFNCYFGGVHDRSALTTDLGKVFRAAAACKPWPACGGTHSHIEAALMLAKKFDIKPDDVEEVTVFVGDTTINLCQPLEARRRPATTLDAKYSIPFSTAVAIVKRNVTLRDYSETGLEDMAVLKFAQKVTPKYDGSIQHAHGLRPAKVEVKMRDGKTHSQYIDLPYYYRSPMTLDDLVSKFRDCISFRANPLPVADVNKVIEMVGGMEHLGDAGEIVRLLA